MNMKTKLTKIGRDPKKNKGFLNPGIYKGSTIIFDDYKSYFNDVNRKTDASALYGINNNPLIEKLEKALTNLYKAHDTVIAPSGLAAVIIPFFAFLEKNDEIIMNDSLYSPTRSYCEKILKKLGIKIKYFHPTKNINKFEKLITKKTKIISTIGPSSNHPNIISRLIKKGMDVARINMAHTSDEKSFKKLINMIGIDHIGIGSDLCNNWPDEVVMWMRNGKWTKKIDYGESQNKSTVWPEQPAWFKKGSDLKNLYEGMLKNGFSENDTFKILGQNWLEFMKIHF